MDKPNVTLIGGALDGSELCVQEPLPRTLSLQALIDPEEGALHLAKPGEVFPSDIVDPADIWRYTYGKSGPNTYIHIHTEVATSHQKGSQ